MTVSEKDPVISENEAAPAVPEAEPSEERKEPSPEAPAKDAESGEKESSRDYAALAREDMRELISLFPHLEGKTTVLELENPLRYAALRDLGLSPKEAYLAIGGYSRGYDNRSHLTSSVPKAAGASSELLSARELDAARELFSGLSDREIQRLYKKVTK